MASVYTQTNTLITEPTSFANAHYIISEFGKVVGIVWDKGRSYERQWHVGDIVKIEPDCRGYICPGITKPGLGKIVEVRRDDNDHWFHVRMLAGNEHGFCKDARFANK